MSGSLNLNLNINRRANDSEKKAGWPLVVSVKSIRVILELGDGDIYMEFLTGLLHTGFPLYVLMLLPP